MEAIKKMIGVLNNLIILLNKTGEERWALYFLDIRKRFMANEDSTTIAREILNVYAGMGTFNDLVLVNKSLLKKSGYYNSEFPDASIFRKAVLKEENEEFEKLQVELYYCCKDIIPNYLIEGNSENN